jgi:ribokinase
MEEITLWPYILPLPLDRKRRELVMSVLKSSIATAILRNIKLDEPSFQQELIHKLPYSNKTIIQKLKLMTKAGILYPDMQVVKTKNERRIWIKYYKPTNLGKWLILLFTSPEEISVERTKNLVEELFTLYTSSIMEICKKHQIDIEKFHQVLSREQMQYLVKSAKQRTKSKVAVFGSVALDIYGYIESFPKKDETSYVEEIASFPGGMGANVAIALAKLKVPVVFNGKIGDDQTGRNLLQNLIKNNVDVSNVSISPQKSLNSLILRNHEGDRWVFAIGSKDAAISLSSPEEIPWNTIVESKIIYIGEVFLEIASLIASFAKSINKTVIYRPGTPYLKYEIGKLHPVLENTDLFIMNETGWEVLHKSSKDKIKTPTDIFDYGVKTLIITKGRKGCEIHTKEKSQVIAVSEVLTQKLKIVDPTGAGDGFSAGLIKQLLEGKNLMDAIKYAQIVAILTCSRIGASPAFPTLEEVDEVIEKYKLL